MRILAVLELRDGMIARETLPALRAARSLAAARGALLDVVLLGAKGWRAREEELRYFGAEDGCVRHVREVVERSNQSAAAHLAPFVWEGSYRAVFCADTEKGQKLTGELAHLMNSAHVEKVCGFSAEGSFLLEGPGEPVALPPTAQVVFATVADRPFDEATGLEAGARSAVKRVISCLSLEGLDGVCAASA